MLIELRYATHRTNSPSICKIKRFEGEKNSFKQNLLKILRLTESRGQSFHFLRKYLNFPTSPGFNQLFDDPNDTKARRMEVGFDTHFSNKVFAGFEISRRDLAIPILAFPTPDLEQKENLY